MTPYPPRVTPRSRESRTARGLTVAAVGVVLAVGGHLAGGGTLAAGSATLPLVAAIGAGGCVLASSRPWTTGRLFVTLASLQAVVHVALAAGGPVDPRLSPLGVAGAHAHGATGSHLEGLAQPAHVGHGGTTMLAAHLVAVLLAALALSRGERAVLVLWHALRVALGAPVRVAARVPGRAARPVAGRPLPLLDGVVLTSHGCRAPPRVA